MLDLAGQDADEFFEDIGHSTDARDELKKHLLGVLTMTEEEIAERKAAAELAASKSGGSNMMFLILVVLVAVVYGYYKSQN
jgi:cytochrome b involved in lipid metabolism